ncbi:hypothetical protein IV01_11495 [Pseudomonas syringae]|uniref:BIG2 domain-containing protein n=1 Tax=Pseudomonas syringae TaxID=317 RepID=A0A085VJR6_PSESX|nr:hypothetical protein IV01_11495 [Pseudomonas syringae]
MDTSYQLLWDGNPIGDIKLVAEDDKPGDILTLEIPVDALINGDHRLAYRLVNLENGVISDSQTTPIQIDRTAPGNPLIAPIIFPTSIQNGLTSAELEDMGNVLMGLIASYNDMKEGDVVRSYWGAVEGPVAIVDKDDMGLKRVELEFSREFLESIGDIEAAVYYTVTDLAGNLSMDSQAIQVKLLLLVLPELPLPVVKEANGDLLDPADAVNGATVLIGASAELRSGDRVIVQWNGPRGSDSKEKVITAPDAGKDLEVLFSAVLVDANSGQTVSIDYRLIRANGSEQASAALALKIQPGLAQLPAPQMDSVGPDGILIPSNIPESGATVRVRYEGMSSGDHVFVSWQGADAYQTPGQVVGAEVELLFNVPKVFINQSIGGSASVTYTVTRAGTGLVSTPLFLQVSQGLTLDPSPVTLSGKIYLIPASPELMPAFPAGTTVKRTASGGQAPYSYRSSNPLVAQVDHEGLASVRGNGTATISVSDATGETRSYQVIVTGVIHCVGLGNDKFSQTSAAAASQGLRIPSADELNQIYNTYGNRWPMGNAIYWSSTALAQNLAGMKWYSTKNLVTGANFKVFEHKTALGVGIR